MSFATACNKRWFFLTLRMREWGRRVKTHSHDAKHWKHWCQRAKMHSDYAKHSSWCHDDAKHPSCSIEKIKAISCAAERGHDCIKNMTMLVFVKSVCWSFNMQPHVACTHLWFTSLIENTESFLFWIFIVWFDVTSSVFSFTQSGKANIFACRYKAHL